LPLIRFYQFFYRIFLFKIPIPDLSDANCSLFEAILIVFLSNWILRDETLHLREPIFLLKDESLILCDAISNVFDPNSILLNEKLPLYEAIPIVSYAILFICFTLAGKDFVLSVGYIKRSSLSLCEWLLLSWHSFFCQLVSLKSFRLTSVFILSSQAL